jgi:hypothetical protein
VNTCSYEVIRHHAVIGSSSGEADRQVDAWKQKERDAARDEIFIRATFEEKFRRFGIPIPVPRKAD